MKTTPIKVGPMTYEYGAYVLQRVRGGGGLWVAFDDHGNEVYVRTSRQGLIDLIDREPRRCSWLVEVANDNPEPSCPADCVDIVECGAFVTEIGEGWRCDNGHQYLGLEIESRLDCLREQGAVV